MAHRPRVTREEAEHLLGRPCPHERFQPDYCRWCANLVSSRRQTQDWLKRFDKAEPRDPRAPEPLI